MFTEREEAAGHDEFSHSVLSTFDAEDLRVLWVLLKEFTPHPERLTADKLEEVLDQPNFHLLICRDVEGTIVAMGSGEIIDTLESKKMYIDHVVVAEEHRGKGIGKELTRRFIEIARENGVERITLTSRFDRTIAHQMYLKQGFKQLPNKAFGFSL